MNNEPESRFRVTSDDIRCYDWQACLNECKRKDCHDFYSALLEKLKAYKDAGDDLGYRVFSLLSVVASFHPNYDSKGNPYGSLRSGFDGKRSLNAEDLTDTDLAALGGVVDEIEEPEFRARVGDILWVCKRDFKAAQTSVRALIESARRIKTNDLWPPYAERLERAVHLSAKLGFGKPLHLETIQVVEAAIGEIENDLTAGLLCHRLMCTLLAHDAGDSARLVALSERLATEFAALGNWDFSEAYWESAARWHRRSKNEADERRCIIAAAECNVSKAEANLASDRKSYGFAAHWTGRGVEALRQARADSNRIAVVHRRFLELQKLSLTEMEAAETNVEKIPGFRDNEKQAQETAVRFVSGHTFPDAVARLLLVAKPTDTAALRKRVDEHSKEFIFSQLVDTVAIDHAGKVADRLTATKPSPEDETDESARKNMVQQARMVDWQIRVVWNIEPARRAILAEHSIRRLDLAYLVTNNPFIAQGHEGIYLRGLQAGFFGDWLVAMHLLIPQIEASIRQVLQQHGVITSTLESDGTQKERDLNQMLWMPETEKIFGTDIMFDLRGILIERFGYNMRNEAAHGLMPEGSFYHHGSVYLWWLILRLCWHGFRIAQSTNSAE